MQERITAGGVVVKDNEILFIKHRDDGKLGFPKGWVDEGETIEEAAIRETQEETGLRGLKIVEKLGIVERRRVEETGLEVMKIIHLFLMAVETYVQEKAQEENEWFGIDEAVKNMKYPQEAEFLLEHKDAIFE